MVSGVTSGASTDIKINADANIFVSEIEHGSTLAFEIKEGRQAYFLCIEGSSKICGDLNGEITLNRHDAAEIYGAINIFVAPTSSEKIHVLIVEMEFTGKGRTDLK